MKKIQWTLWLFLCIHAGLRAQEKLTLNGYLNDMQSVYYIKDLGWLWENQLHNRMNIHYYPTSWLHASVQFRSRFIQGNTVQKIPGYQEMIGKDAGWLDLTAASGEALGDNNSYVITSMIDRAWVECTLGNLVATVGRQRINWGQTLVFNPNDIFNTYSYFDVDYTERPGSDAVRLQYYTGMASNLEAAAKVDSAGRLTAAAYFRFNLLNFDFQVLGGVLNDDDVVLGSGWSGNIGGVSFRGEASYFRQRENFADTTGDLLASAGLDYTFSNSLWIQVEALYSSIAKNRKIYNFMQILGSDMNVKNIGFTEWSLFSSLSYPLTPLINTTVSAMYYPDWKGFYVGPTLDVSVSNTMDFSLIFQVFSAELEDYSGISERQNTGIGYARIKWNF